MNKEHEINTSKAMPGPKRAQKGKSSKTTHIDIRNYLKPSITANIKTPIGKATEGNQGRDSISKPSNLKSKSTFNNLGDKDNLTNDRPASNLNDQFL